MIIVAIVVTVVMIIAIIAHFRALAEIDSARREIDRVSSSRSSRIDACLASSQDEATR